MADETQTKMDESEVNAERGEIQWTVFEGKYVKLRQENERIMKLANPGQVEKQFGKETTYALEFDVLELDSDVFEVGEKIFSTSSRRLAQRLRPIVKEMEENGQPIKVSITKVGTKFDTNYIVKKVKDD